MCEIDNHIKSKDVRGMKLVMRNEKTEKEDGGKKQTKESYW